MTRESVPAPPKLCQQPRLMAGSMRPSAAAAEPGFVGGIVTLGVSSVGHGGKGMCGGTSCKVAGREKRRARSHGVVLGSCPSPDPLPGVPGRGRDSKRDGPGGAMSRRAIRLRLIEVRLKRQMMQAREYNFDGIVGPTHNYAGLSHGNLASTKNKLSASNPRAAAMEGLAKMRTLHGMGVPQAVLPPQERPHVPTLRRLGFSGSDVQVIEEAYRHYPCCWQRVRVHRRCGQRMRQRFLPRRIVRIGGCISRRRIWGDCCIGRLKPRRRQGCSGRFFLIRLFSGITRHCRPRRHWGMRGRRIIRRCVLNRVMLASKCSSMAGGVECSGYRSETVSGSADAGGVGGNRTSAWITRRTNDFSSAEPGCH